MNAINILTFFVFSIILVSSVIRLYRWRKSAFDSTNAYLRNLRCFQPGEKVCIQAPEEPGIHYIRSEKSSKTVVYWEYWYTVEGTQYCKSFFGEDDDDELPSEIKVHYNRKNPKMMYFDGAVRSGVLGSAVAIALASLFLFLIVASYVW